MRKATALLALLLAGAACADPSRPTGPLVLKPGEPSRTVSGRPISGEYIVVLTPAVPDVAAEAARLAAAHGGTVLTVFQHVLHGFAARIPDPAADALSNAPSVEYVEQSQEVSAIGVQTPVTWGLDRIDQRTLPLDNSYTYNFTGTGVTAYIFDTGIHFSHQEFGGRAFPGFTAITDGNGANDCNGHGTHVAGTVGGSTYGVAKAVVLMAVRVLDCSGNGTTVGVISGLDWAAGDHANSPAVGNMSLAGWISQALNDAVARAIGDGIAMAVAAGNNNFDACWFSPASAPEAMTIGATASNDARASFSNYGPCVDFFAPGVGITSAWWTSNTATATISGTSMASPHAAGAAALVLEQTPSASPQAVRDALFAATTRNVVSNALSTNAHLLYTLGSVEPPPPPPPSDITLSARARKVKRSYVVDLTWLGATGPAVDIFRNSSLLTTTQNDGSHRDTGVSRGTTYTYQVCNAGTPTCSNLVTVTP